MHVEVFSIALPYIGSSAALWSGNSPQALRLATATEEDTLMTTQFRKRSRPASITGQESVNEAEPAGNRAGEAPAPIAQNDTGVAAGGSPTDAKLKLVLLMMLDGHSQKDIAKHFKVDPRTIRNWQGKLDGLKLGIVENLNPLREVERILVRLASSEVRYRNIREDAMARLDYVTAIRCEKELTRLTFQRLGFLSKLGMLDHYRLPQTNTDDPGKQQVDLLTEMFEVINSSVTEGVNETPSTDE